MSADPKQQGAAFWNGNPCGGSWRSYREFMAWIQRTEPYIYRVLDRHDGTGKRVLEVGCGQGSTLNYLPGLGANVCGVDMSKEAEALDRKADTALRDLYKNLTAWQKCQVARHPDRPHCRDYIDRLFTEYTSLAGDRAFADDHAVMGGLARFNDQPVMVIGHEKGNDTKSRIQRNFGMARPDGYRKAIRLMDMAYRFRLPVITLIDTAGSYCLGPDEVGHNEGLSAGARAAARDRRPRRCRSRPWRTTRSSNWTTSRRSTAPARSR